MLDPKLTREVADHSHGLDGRQGVFAIAARHGIIVASPAGSGDVGPRPSSNVCSPPGSLLVMSKRGKPHRRRSRPPRPKSLPPIPILSLQEMQAKEATRAELEPMKVAHEATLALADLIMGHQQPPEEHDTPFGRQNIALGLLSVMMMRTARLCLLGISAGYVPETFSLKRRVTEIAWRTDAILADDSGEHATQWLYGKASKSSRLARKASRAQQDWWEEYSLGTHADGRLIPAQIAGEGEMRRVDVHVTPVRDRDLANYLLVEVASEVHAQAVSVAERLIESLADRQQERLDHIAAELSLQRDRWYPSGAAMQAR
jgi:hypothetical protein